MFYRHLIIKKIEDYFFRKGVYNYAHIARPLGTIKEGYIYEWVFGEEGFVWEYTEVGGKCVRVMLDEWGEFIGAFLSAGIDLGADCTDADDGRTSQNIIHQLDPYMAEETLSRLWKRIDFGSESIRIDFDKITEYLTDHEQNMRQFLSIGRFELLYLATEYLKYGSKISERDLGKLEQLTLSYRMSTLSHLNMSGVETAPGIKLISE